VPFEADISYAPSSDVAASVNKGPIETALDFINFGIGIAATLLGFVLMIFGIIKFFFIDNLLLTLALYISVTMAYSAVSSVGSKGFDIWKFYKKFFGLQRSLMNFMVELWNYLIQIISSFRGIFRI